MSFTIIYFTDDGFTINQLSLIGIEMNGKRKKAIASIVNQYGVEILGESKGCHNYFKIMLYKNMFTHIISSLVLL